MASLDTSTLRQLRADYPEINPRTVYDIPGDPISQHFAIMADAAREGHRSGQYLTPVVENVQGYFERSMVPLMEEIENSREMCTLDGAAMAEADNLIRTLEDDADSLSPNV